MAYENYRFVSWAAKTPLTGDRLAQMSTNIEQVKLATDDRPQGIIKYNKLTTLTSYSSQNYAENKLVYLRDDTPSGADNRVNADSNRYVRLNVSFPGIKVSGRGAEDSRFELTIQQGDDLVGSVLSRFYLNPHIYAFYDVSSDPSTTTVSVRSTGNDVYFGAGSYSTVIDTSTGWTNEKFFVAIERKPASNTTNAPTYTIMSSSTSPLEFYAEDIGGVS